MEPFKNLLGASAAEKIARAFASVEPAFPRKEFTHGLKTELEPLALKERMRFLAQRLHDVLPRDPKKCFPVLLRALKGNDGSDGGLEGFLVWPLTHIVAVHGQEHFDLSMAALKEMTKVFTAEFAIRPFLRQQETRTLKVLSQWSRDPSEHVRRLCSEGTRPLLPWGEKLPRFVDDPELTWEILSRLRADPAVYVRKSVANHINDHSKSHADWVVRELKKWRAEAPNHPELDWIIRHGTRVLVKKGHQGALALHGVGKGKVRLKRLRILTPEVVLGGNLEVEVRLENTSRREAVVIVDHELMLLGARQQMRPRVVKGKKLTLAGGESQVLTMRLRIKPVTTRRYYEGRQTWAVLVNGERSKALPFRLECP